MISKKAKETHTVTLSNIPVSINKLIRKEQIRLELHEDLNLKKPEIVYRMIRDWYRLKTIEAELTNKLNELKNS